MITTLDRLVNVISPSKEHQLVAINVNLMVRIYECLVLSSLMQGYRLTVSAIFPRALPAAARVDVRPGVVPEDAKFSVVCFALAGAWAGFLAVPLLPAF